jgi:hypothetical protein
MDFFEKYNLTGAKILKIGGLILLGFVLLMVAISLINAIGSGLRSSVGDISSERAYDGAMPQSAANYKSSNDMALSTRNVMPEDSYTAGDDAEQFEVTEYSARIETRRLDTDCEAVLALKTKDYIIFERSNKGETNCDYRFKVKKENTEEVLSLIKDLDPRELNQSVETIKKQIEDYTSREEILKKKLTTIEETMNSAVASYDEISKLAATTRDAASLASVIKSKIEIIESLSKQKINISSELDALGRQKAEQLDRLAYTYFNVSIYENKYIDLDYIKDSWKSSIKTFVFDMNRVAQDLSIGLVRLIVYVFQYLLYLMIVVLVAKYTWVLFKRIWKGKTTTNN